MKSSIRSKYFAHHEDETASDSSWRQPVGNPMSHIGLARSSKPCRPRAWPRRHQSDVSGADDLRPIADAEVEGSGTVGSNGQLRVEGRSGLVAHHEHVSTCVAQSFDEPSQRWVIGDRGVIPIDRQCLIRSIHPAHVNKVTGRRVRSCRDTAALCRTGVRPRRLINQPSARPRRPRRR